MRKAWTEQERKLITEKYSNNYTAEIAAQLNRSLASVYTQANLMGLKKSVEFTKLLLQREGEKLKILGKGNQFQKGNISHNLGQKMSKEMYEKVKVTMFAVGNEPHNTKWDGHERIDTKDGYVYVRISKAKYVLKHRHLWEQHYGPIGNNIITFKDGNKLNITIDNLVMMTKRDNMIRNNGHHYPTELKQLIKLNNKLKKTINEK